MAIILQLVLKNSKGFSFLILSLGCDIESVAWEKQKISIADLKVCTDAFDFFTTLR